MNYLDHYERDREAIDRALSQRLEEAGVLRYEKVYHDGHVRHFYERAGVLRELQIPKGMTKELGAKAERIHIEGKWRLMYSLSEIGYLLPESPTLEGQAKQRQSAELWIQQALLNSCASVGLEATKEIIDTFFRSLDQQHDDDIEGNDFEWSDIL